MFLFDKQLITTLPDRRHVHKNAQSGESVGIVCIVPHPKRGVLYFVQTPTETLGPSFQRSIFPVRSWRCTAGCCDGHTPGPIACGDGLTPGPMACGDGLTPGPIACGDGLTPGPTACGDGHTPGPIA